MSYPQLPPVSSQPLPTPIGSGTTTFPVNTAAGQGGAGLSRGAAGHSSAGNDTYDVTDPVGLAHGHGSATNDSIASLRLALMDTLLSPSGVDFDALLGILKLLVVENKAYFQSHSSNTQQLYASNKNYLYMGLSDREGLDHGQLADLAKKLKRSSSDQMQKLLSWDIESQQLMSQINLEWARHQQAHAQIHAQAAKAQNFIDPQTAKAQRAKDRMDLTSPDVLRHRAKLRDTLLSALVARDFESVKSTLQQLPSGVKLESYLPVPNPHKIHQDCDDHAKAYEEDCGPNPQLSEYAEWCRSHWVTNSHLEGTLKRAISERKETILKAKANKVCQALRDLDECADEKTLKKSAKAIKVQMKKDLALSASALALQPYASTRLMLQRCTVLEKFIFGRNLTAFRAKLEEAHALRKGAATRLEAELLKPQPDFGEVRILSTYLHARASTIPVAEYVVHCKDKTQLKAAQAWLETVNFMQLNVVEALGLGEMEKAIKKALSSHS